MKKLSKYFTQSLAIPDIEPHSFFLIHGIRERCVHAHDQAIVEVRVSSDVPFEAIPSLLFATYSLYTRSTSGKCLFIIADIREASDTCIQNFARSLKPYNSWLEGTIGCILWVAKCSMPRCIENVIGEDLMPSRLTNVVCDMDSINDYIEEENRSTLLNGSISPEISQQFFHMRVRVESLLDKTHKTAKLYMKMHEDLRHYRTPRNLNSIDIDSLRKLCAELEKRWLVLKNESDAVFLRENGNVLCDELSMQYSILNCLDTYLYRSAVERAISAFLELSLVMQRSETSFTRCLQSLHSTLKALEFINFIPKLKNVLDAQLFNLEQLKIVKIFSVIRLNSQIKQIEKKSTEINAILKEANVRHQNASHLLEEGFFDDKDRKTISEALESLSDIIKTFETRIRDVHDAVQTALDSRILIDQVYEWALLHAKRSDDERETASLLEKYPEAAMNRLQEYVVSCTDNMIRQELEKLLFDCEQAMETLTRDKLLNSRCGTSGASSQDSAAGTCSQGIGSTTVDSCSGGEPHCSIIDLSLPKSHSELSDSISDTPMEVYSDVECSAVALERNGEQQEQRSISPAPTQYEIPISKMVIQNDTRMQDLKDVEEIRWRRNSWAPSAHTEPVDFIEESAIGTAPVTLDLTNKVITSMSTNTLHKRLDQRRSISTVPSRLPNPFLINGVARPGSARFILSHKSRRPLMRTSSADVLEQDYRTVLSAFQFLDDDSCSLFESSLSPISSAFSALDFSMRSEQIDVIREWLSPAKTSDANFRIECTVVRDLLDSEIDYVGALRLIVQDYLPEMARVDIPSALRGKKSCIFGNVEKLFQFHAHSFLPQLISQLRFRSSEESLSLTIGRLFLENIHNFELYALYAKNKPKSDALMRECGHKFFSSVQSMGDLSHLLVKPIERIGKYTLALQQLLNAAATNKFDVLEILEKVATNVGQQIRRGADMLAMERIIGCDLNLKEQGNLLRHDTMFVTEKRGLQSKKRVRSVFLFDHCVVITKPRLSRSWRASAYDELKYKCSIQMTDCGLTEMVKDSKVKFELWFRKQKNSSTYVMEAQSACIRDAWVGYIRKILWDQATQSRKKNIREKANMGLEFHSSYLHLGPQHMMNGSREPYFIDGARRPRSLISLTASSCSSSNNLIRLQGRGTCEVGGDLCRVEEDEEWDSANECATHAKYNDGTLPRYRAPPPPPSKQIN